MKHIYLMRHGQTLFNVLGLNQGHSDSPLTPSGIKQAKLAKQWYIDNGIQFDKVFCSTSERAMDTTELITDLPYTKLKALKEICLGTKEATSFKDNPTYPYGDYFIQFGGEGLDAFTNRIHSTVYQIAQETSAENILIVSHGMAIRQFLVALDHGTTQVIGNCGILILQYEDNQLKLVDIIDQFDTERL